MKMIVITFAVVIGLGLTSFAQGGLFQRGNTPENSQENSSLRGGMPGIPGHGENTDQPAPLGSGIVLLTALGAAYGFAKKHREE